MKLADRLAAGTCYVIAEAGSNHNGDLEMARRLIEVSAGAGADAVKFQLFKADTLYARGAGKSDYLKSDVSIVDIIRKMEMPEAWLPDLARHCERLGVDFLASAFDERAVDVLDPFVSSHKCASYELTHHPLLDHLSRKRKPVLLSTGAAELREVADAVAVVRAAGAPALVLLQCTASYPAPVEQANVRALVTLREEFGVPAGLSDHTSDPLIAPAIAAALGAAVIEKHFTLDNSLPGPDHAFAIEPAGLAAMIRMVRDVERARGDGRKVTLPAEQELRHFARRSIFAIAPIRAGETFGKGNVAVLRAGKLAHGLPPSRWTAVLGKRARRDITADVAVTEDDVDFT